jgi:hypothetical protein
MPLIQILGFVPPSSERGAGSESHPTASSFEALQDICGHPSMTVNQLVVTNVLWKKLPE